MLVNPAQPAVWRAFQRRQFVLAGPMKLEQGQAVLIGCVPIFLASTDAPAEHERFWGLSLIIIDLEPLLGEAGLPDTASGLQWALRGADGAEVQPERVPVDAMTVAAALDLAGPVR